MRLLLAAAAAAMSLTPAFASQVGTDAARGDASVRFFAACSAYAARENPELDPTAVCACGAGYFAGALNDRELEIASRLMVVGGEPSPAAAEARAKQIIQELVAEGYTIQEIQAVNAEIGAQSGRGDSACRVFETLNNAIS